MPVRPADWPEEIPEVCTVRGIGSGDVAACSGQSARVFSVVGRKAVSQRFLHHAPRRRAQSAREKPGGRNLGPAGKSLARVESEWLPSELPHHPRKATGFTRVALSAMQPQVREDDIGGETVPIIMHLTGEFSELDFPRVGDARGRGAVPSLQGRLSFAAAAPATIVRCSACPSELVPVRSERHGW